MNKEKINEIMKETCWHSLAFCCSLERNCPIRDEVMNKLGLTKKRFVELKKVFDNLIYDILK